MPCSKSASRHGQRASEMTVAWLITYLVIAQVRGFLSVLCEHLAPPPTFLTFLFWHLPRCWLLFLLPHLVSCRSNVHLDSSLPPPSPAPRGERLLQPQGLLLPTRCSGSSLQFSVTRTTLCCGCFWCFSPHRLWDGGIQCMVCRFEWMSEWLNAYLVFSQALRMQKPWLLVLIFYVLSVTCSVIALS